MMDKKTGTFRDLPDEFAKRFDEATDWPSKKEVLDSVPLPTLHVDERVEIKGIEFYVLAMMPHGELRLMMVKKP